MLLSAATLVAAVFVVVEVEVTIINIIITLSVADVPVQSSTNISCVGFWPCVSDKSLNVL